MSIKHGIIILAVSYACTLAAEKPEDSLTGKS